MAVAVAPISLDAVRAIAQRDGASSDVTVEGRSPFGSIWTWSLGPVVVRVDGRAGSTALDAEALALRTLASATTPAIAPTLISLGDIDTPAGPRRVLSRAFIEGAELDSSRSSTLARQLGALFATLHGARVFDLLHRFPVRRPMTLMEAFKRTSDRLRTWMLAREADGIGQDLLTLTLSDLSRALRAYAIAQDHVFRTAQRRVLCHGRPRPDLVVAPQTAAPLCPLQLVGFDRAYLGDAAEDLAAFAVAAGLEEPAEDAFLDGYIDRLDELGRPDARFLERYFAHRTLRLLAAPIENLSLLVRIKSGDEPVAIERLAALEQLSEQTYDQLTACMNGLRDLSGHGRAVVQREVVAMGRLVAYEEMILEGRTFHIALVGAPYAGKTEVGSILAERLRCAFLSTSVLGRAALYVGQLLRTNDPAAIATALVTRNLRIDSHRELPFYRAFLEDEDVTDALRAVPAEAALRLVQEPAFCQAFREAFGPLFAAGLVVEGPGAGSLVHGLERRCFVLRCDDAVRRARLMSHQPSLQDEDEADARLAQLDAATPPSPVDATLIDAGSSPAATAALQILRRLLPPGTRERSALVIG